MKNMTGGLLVTLLCATSLSAKRSDPAPLTIDAHTAIPDPLDHPGQKGTLDSDTPIDARLMRKGGLGGIIIDVHVRQDAITPASVKAAYVSANAQIAAIKEIARRHPDKTALALSASDIRRIAKSKRTAIILGVLNAFPYGNTPDALPMLYHQGVRIVGFTHAGNNQFADSSRPMAPGDTPDANGGLTPLGRHWISEANRLGVLLDVSQISTKTLFQVIALSKAPVIASHSGIKSLVDLPRNLSDTELDAIAKSGGAVCIVAFGLYLRNYTAVEGQKMLPILEKWGGINAVYQLRGKADQDFHKEMESVTPLATLDDYIDSIDYAVKRMGIDHVCLSTDFNDGSSGIKGWMNESEVPGITAALRRRGYDAQNIAKLWSGNILRLLQTAQDHAAKHNMRHGNSVLGGR